MPTDDDEERRRRNQELQRLLGGQTTAVRGTVLTGVNLKPAAVERLRGIQGRADAGASLTVWQRVFVGLCAFRCAGREP